MDTEQPSRRAYVVTFALLLGLLLLTVWVSHVHLGPFNPAVALGIAFAKAMLVILYFMHVRHAAAVIRLAIAGVLVWLGVLIALTMGDYLTRSWLPTGPSEATETQVPHLESSRDSLKKLNLCGQSARSIQTVVPRDSAWPGAVKGYADAPV